MRLKLNSDKTSLLVVLRSNKQKWKDEIVFIDGKQGILPSKQIKILGWIQNGRLSQDTTLSNNISSINNIL